MKIALLWPNYWPYIRRGTERMVRDIGYHLAEQGHSVHVITSKPGPSKIDHDGPLTIFKQSRMGHPLLAHYSQQMNRLVFYFDLQGIRALPHMLREEYDLIHSFMFVYYPAQKAAEKLRGTPTVYHIVTIPPHWGRRGEERLVRMSLDGNVPVRVFSKFCGDFMAAHYGVNAHVVPPTVDRVFFETRYKKDLSRPKILYTADLTEPAKGPHVLAMAFNEVHRKVPNAVLSLAGPIGRTPVAVHHLLRLLSAEARNAVEVLGPGAVDSLPRLYAEAAVSVLPSLHEPFGMVLTESLASGTVVVGSRSGAIPEIITRPDVGLLFQRHADDDMESARNLSAALLNALDLAADPGTSDRCRDHARNWTWDMQKEPFEALHRHSFANKNTSRVAVQSPNSSHD